MKTQGEADKKPEIQNKGEPVAEKAAAGQVETLGQQVHTEGR